MKTDLSILQKILFATAVSVVAGCSTQEPKPRVNEIVKVGLATSGCYGECPFLAIEVDSSLNYKFYGGDYSGKEGFYIGRVTPAFWDILNLLFEQAEHRSFVEPDLHVVDAMVYEFVIRDSDTLRHFGLPDVEFPPLPGEELTQDEVIVQRMRRVLRWLMFSYKGISMNQVNDTLDFETTSQYPPPPVRVETVQFSAPDE